MPPNLIVGSCRAYLLSTAMSRLSLKNMQEFRGFEMAEFLLVGIG